MRYNGCIVNEMEDDMDTPIKPLGEDKLQLDVEEINLKTNYRSTKNIINHFLQFDKSLYDFFQ